MARSAIAVRAIFEGGHVTDNEVTDYTATIRNTRLLSMATFAYLSVGMDSMAVDCVSVSIPVLNAF